MERWLELTERICLPILLPCIILIALHFSEGAYGAFRTYCWGCLDGVDYGFFFHSHSIPFVLQRSQSNSTISGIMHTQCQQLPSLSVERG